MDAVTHDYNLSGLRTTVYSHLRSSSSALLLSSPLFSIPPFLAQSPLRIFILFFLAQRSVAGIIIRGRGSCKNGSSERNSIPIFNNTNREMMGNFGISELMAQFSSIYGTRVIVRQRCEKRKERITRTISR